jgi:ubiquinone/menaquinone biosynthesis C-methylase UbiE
VSGRVTDYDSIADRFDARYGLYGYDGVRETLLNFLGDTPNAALEVGCGTGHWLAALQGRLNPSPHNAGPPSPEDTRVLDRSANAPAERRLLAGVDPSAPMLARARIAAPAARLVRARAEDLPWRNETFDRVFCVNALHHFSDRHRFFEEARRVLKPGGGLLTIGKDPHVERDIWWVYDYFEDTRDIDRARFAQVKTLRGELAHAGFAWAESFEADHIEGVHPAGAALAAGPDGAVARSYTSQLTVLSDEEFARGVARIREANAAVGGELQLVVDFRLYATIGWLQPSRGLSDPTAGPSPMYESGEP